MGAPCAYHAGTRPTPRRRRCQRSGPDVHAPRRPRRRVPAGKHLTQAPRPGRALHTPSWPRATHPVTAPRSTPRHGRALHAPSPPRARHPVTAARSTPRPGCAPCTPSRRVTVAGLVCAHTHPGRRDDCRRAQERGHCPQREGGARGPAPAQHNLPHVLAHAQGPGTQHAPAPNHAGPRTPGPPTRPRRGPVLTGCHACRTTLAHSMCA